MNSSLDYKTIVNRVLVFVTTDGNIHAFERLTGRHLWTFSDELLPKNNEKCYKKMKLIDAAYASKSLHGEDLENHILRHSQRLLMVEPAGPGLLFDVCLSQSQSVGGVKPNFGVQNDSDHLSPSMKTHVTLGGDEFIEETLANGISDQGSADSSSTGCKSRLLPFTLRSVTSGNPRRLQDGRLFRGNTRSTVLSIDLSTGAANLDAADSESTFDTTTPLFSIKMLISRQEHRMVVSSIEKSLLRSPSDDDSVGEVSMNFSYIEYSGVLGENLHHGVSKSVFGEENDVNSMPNSPDQLPSRLPTILNLKSSNGSSTDNRSETLIRRTSNGLVSVIDGYTGQILWHRRFQTPLASAHRLVYLDGEFSDQWDDDNITPADDPINLKVEQNRAIKNDLREINVISLSSDVSRLSKSFRQQVNITLQDLPLIKGAFTNNMVRDFLIYDYEFGRCPFLVLSSINFEMIPSKHVNTKGPRSSKFQELVPYHLIKSPYDDNDDTIYYDDILETFEPIKFQLSKDHVFVDDFTITRRQLLPPPNATRSGVPFSGTFFITIIVCLGATLYYWHIQTKKRRVPKRSLEKALHEDGKDEILFIDYENIIGLGSDGTVVFRGTYFGRPVAVKRVLSHFAHMSEREMRMLQAADGHPNIVRMHYFCTDETFTYLVMDRFDCSLATLFAQDHKIFGDDSNHKIFSDDSNHEKSVIKNVDDTSSCVESCWSPSILDSDKLSCSASIKSEKGQSIAKIFTFQERVEIVRQIALAIKYLHDRDLVHRDIKPQNVLVSTKDDQFKVVLGDFGLVKRHALVNLQNASDSMDSAIRAVTTSVQPGTRAWSAPEVLRGQEASPSSDLFSFACLSYYILSGGVGHPFAISDDFDCFVESDCVVSTLSLPSSTTTTHTTRTASVDGFDVNAKDFESANPRDSKNTFLVTKERYNYQCKFVWTHHADSVIGARIASGTKPNISLVRDPVARNLLVRLLDPDPKNRIVTTTIDHPLFWAISKRLQMLLELSDLLEARYLNHPDPLGLESRRLKILNGHTPWSHRLDTPLWKDITRFRFYDPRSVRDLLRAIRNKRSHFHEHSAPIRALFNNRPEGVYEYFCTRFPYLFIECFLAMEQSSHAQEEPFSRAYFQAFK